jgi:glutamate-ammonia-ligase adenylyltransferase
LLVTMRLVAPGSLEPPPATRPIVARACGVESWDALVCAYDAARALIGGEWRRISGVTGDSAAS